MGITFAPRRGAILMCDFGPDPSESSTYPVNAPPLSMSPEIRKLRRVVVVSTNALNHPHGREPGLCSVVPFSATRPGKVGPWDIFIPAGSYRSLTVDVWAKCASTAQVSHGRLDRVLAGRTYVQENMTAPDLALIDGGIRAALNL
jgi:uncharacterized protein YifN (PemK superfamily)